MKVSEVIKALSEMNQDAEVVIKDETREPWQEDKFLRVDGFEFRRCHMSTDGQLWSADIRRHSNEKGAIVILST